MLVHTRLIRPTVPTQACLNSSTSGGACPLRASLRRKRSPRRVRLERRASRSVAGSNDDGGRITGHGRYSSRIIHAVNRNSAADPKCSRSEYIHGGLAERARGRVTSTSTESNRLCWCYAVVREPTQEQWSRCCGLRALVKRLPGRARGGALARAVGCSEATEVVVVVLGEKSLQLGEQVVEAVRSACRVVR